MTPHPYKPQTRWVFSCWDAMEAARNARQASQQTGRYRPADRNDTSLTTMEDFVCDKGDGITGASVLSWSKAVNRPLPRPNGQVRANGRKLCVYRVADLVSWWDENGRNYLGRGKARLIADRESRARYRQKRREALYAKSPTASVGKG